MRKYLIVVFAALTLARPLAAEQETEPAASPVSPDCERSGVTCGILETCAQACGYLRQCGLGKLDRDKDGIPCESLCPATCDDRS